MDSGRKFRGHRTKLFGFSVSGSTAFLVLNDIHKLSIKKLQRLLRYKTQTTESYLKKIDDASSVGLMLLEKETHT